MCMLVHNICTLLVGSSMHFRRPQINLATLLLVLALLTFKRSKNVKTLALPVAKSGSRAVAAAAAAAAVWCWQGHWEGGRDEGMKQRSSKSTLYVILPVCVCMQNEYFRSPCITVLNSQLLWLVHFLKPHTTTGPHHHTQHTHTTTG